MSDARWTMSRSAARASIVGFGAAVGLVAVGLGVAGAVGVGAAGVGCALAGGAVRSSTVEEPAEGEPGAGEQPKVRRARQSAAQARRIPRPYVAGRQAFTRASERPSGSQDAQPCRIGLLVRGGYCYAVRIAGILLVRQRVG